jgi:hypothetical protein
VGSPVAVGGTGKLRLHARDLKVSEKCTIYLTDLMSLKQVEASVQLVADGKESETLVPIPFGNGALVQARVSTQSAGDIQTTAPLRVGGTETEAADWRPYIRGGSIPDDIIEKIKRNRARYPERKLKAATGKWAGANHWDYKPPKSHHQWAQQFAKTKVDAVTGLVEKHVAQAFQLMLRNEGLPASFQSYDDQIITWGVGLGAKGDGVHVYGHLKKSPVMKKLLDDIGIDFDGTDYHVVDVNAKKVVSSGAGKRGNDSRHVVALDAWRKQNDLIYAIIGMSEDPATREAVAESQWKVYLSNSTKWSGQEKIHSLALYFMITHMIHWMPAMGMNGVQVNAVFAALGATAPSNEIDKKMAPRFANGFIRYAKKYCKALKKPRPGLYKDIHTRTKTRLWEQFRADAKKEGYDPGELVYEEDVASNVL